MEIIYIPVEENKMIAELSLPEGEGPFDSLVWIGDPDPSVRLPENIAVLLIRHPVDHPLWFAALCDELRMQDFYTKRSSLRVDLPISAFRFVAGHPFLRISGIFAQDVKRCFPGNEYS
ncbi:MAG: hypothetical protein E4G74_03685 [Erysipelotrichales bacterium]|nr:MAG: hypothetical protein E4G74_03685 [Erysipelotrichales bacterium]